MAASKHVYAPLPAFKAYLSGGNVGTDRDTSMLAVLESASRSVDGFCNRGSGFGPVLEARTFTSTSSTTPLLLGGDLLSITTLTVDDDDQSPAELTARTRSLTGYIGEVVIDGVWSYDYIAQPTGALDDAVTAETTTWPVADGSLFSVGQTLLVDDEQALVLSIATDNLTVVRGVNGTTADDHLDEAAVSVYLYDASVVDATLRVALRRWKQRDAGLTGMFGGAQAGGDIPMTSNLDTELSILYGSVGHLRFVPVR